VLRSARFADSQSLLPLAPQLRLLRLQRPLASRERSYHRSKVYTWLRNTTCRSGNRSRSICRAAHASRGGVVLAFLRQSPRRRHPNEAAPPNAAANEPPMGDLRDPDVRPGRLGRVQRMSSASGARWAASEEGGDRSAWGGLGAGLRTPCRSHIVFAQSVSARLMRLPGGAQWCVRG
jgi:hypothetical protein